MIRFLFLLFLILSCKTPSESSSFLGDLLKTDLSPEEKAEVLLNEMTFREKVEFIRGQAWKNQGCIPRLGLPPIKYQDATMGISFWGTSFPSTLITTATWDRNRMRDLSRAVAREGIARGEKVILGPGVNIYRMPTGGRNCEYMGEDPFLTSEMTRVYVTEMQNQGAIAVVKHFAANNQDFDRHGTSSDIDERTLREIYLPPFEAAVKAGVGAVMTGYNPVNGFPMSENKRLVTDILKTEWGFDGFVVSDWMSLYSTEGAFTAGVDLEMPSDSSYFAYHKINNLNLPEKESLLNDKVRRILTTYFRFHVYEDFQWHYRLQQNPEEHDVLAREIAEEGIVLLKNEDSILPLPQNEKKSIAVVGYNSRFLNTTTVGACTVFCRRPGRMLTVNLMDGFRPYRDDDTRISHVTMADTVALKKADAVIYVAGLWVFGEGEANDRHWDMKPKNRSDIEKLKRLNSNIIVVSNYGSGIETESWINGVKGLIYLGYAGKWADAALARVIFGDVNPSGKLPFTMVKQWDDFGPVAAQIENPDKLVIWPRDADYPVTPMLGTGRFKVFGGNPKMLKSKNRDIFENDPQAYDRMEHMVYAEGRYLGYRYLDKTGKAAQFPFGFGLSYTSFAFDDLAVSKKTFSVEEGTEVSLTVSNTGERAGAEVVQVYVHDPVSRLDRVYKELKGFEKIFLQPGETRNVTIPLTEEAFRYYDDTLGKWVTEPGQFDILVGNCAENILLRASVTLR